MCKDGSYRDLLWTAALDPIGWLYLAARDITERKRSERELMFADRAKSRFLAMMSHELRTPLNSIIGFSDFLIDGKIGPVNERQARYLRNVNDSGRHLLDLINDLLDFSKIEAGKLDLAITSCSAQALIAHAAATLQPLADARRINLNFDPPGPAPLPAIRADAARFKQILYNLLANAIKFTPVGGDVSVLASLSPDGRHVRTTVADSGPGISEDELAQLFVPFVQLAAGRESGGTGLGLAVTRQLVELMGGQITVESTPRRWPSSWPATGGLRHGLRILVVRRATR